MDALPKPDIIYTHESDLDGLVSGVLLQRLAKKMFKTDVPLAAYHYNAWKQHELRDRAAWAADFNFEARMDRPNWVVIDHHATEQPAKTAHLIHDLTKSAGLLCYELCQQHGLGSQELDRLVHLNNISDLFLEDAADFDLANDYANLVKTYNFWNLHTLLNGQIERLLDHPLLEVIAVKRRIEDPIGYTWSSKNVKAVTPKLGYVEVLVGNTNLIVHELLEKEVTPYPVLMTLLRKSNNVFVASLRSRNGEAIKIAEKLQGGGHANACGFTLPKSVRSLEDALDYIKQVLNPAPKKDAGLNNLESLFALIENEQKK